MEDLGFKQTKEEIQIEGFPDAVKVVQIYGKEAKLLADFTLHLTDLRFAMECLEGINLVANESERLGQGLWHSAVVHFMKCFGKNKSRVSLNYKKVYKGEKLGKEVFEKFRSLRNKHVVHDENAYTQSHPGAILNKKGCDHQIARVVCGAFVAVTLDQGTYSNLHVSITHALKWVEEKIDDLCNRIALDLEAVPYDELFSRKQIDYSPPKIDEIDKPRAPL